MMRRNILIFALYSIIACTLFAIYFSTQIDDLDVVMPLDDVYIHFQYARQLAQGHPYIYNTGELATSGATSFIYPYILAIGYTLGFQGLNLGIWSMLVGCVALIGAMWAIYRLCCVFNAPIWLATITPILFALTGSVSWHAMSGMETMLMICLTLWTLLAYVERRMNLFIVSAVVLALTRPEGSIMAGIATVLFIVRAWFDQSTLFELKQGILLILPLLAIGVQPALNYIMTGSFSASGSQAKSLLAIVPFDLEVVIIRIVVHIGRFWIELFTGYSAVQDLWYVIPLTAPLGMMGWIGLLRKQQYRGTALLILFWLVTVTSAIATLDTAFWHFKRYQMPLIVLFIPLSIIPLVWLLNRSQITRWGVYGLVGVLAPVFAIMTCNSFWATYQLNTNYVREQPLAMARWLAENTPQDAMIAVHDVGMMRYMGGRNTLDIVGLTTPNAAQYWRNGVGAVAEFLMEHQPDYIASYGGGHGYGLYMLADTRLYGDPLAEFQVELDQQKNVALAADSQAIYQPDWDTIITDDPANVLLDVNVANIDSELAVDYQWNWQKHLPYEGFSTVVYDFDLMGCITSHSQLCNVIEGARQLNDADQFIVSLAEPADFEYVILKTRVHARDAISIDILVDDNLIDTQWIPKNPGHWFDIETQIPTVMLNTDATIRIEPQLDEGEIYSPARHMLIRDEAESANMPDSALATYQDSHLQLIDYQVNLSETNLNLILDWYTDVQTVGDYRFFAHLYNNINQPPIAQWDNYLGNNALPLGNWIQGARQDTLSLNTDTLTVGKYQLMIGFYDSTTFDRLFPNVTDDDVRMLDDGRLILQSVEIK